MKSASQNTIRRSIAVPNELVEELRTVAPPELRDNFNRLVTFILMDFTRRQKKYQFEAAMAEMANDSAIQEVSAGLSEEFTERKRWFVNHDQTRRNLSGKSEPPLKAGSRRVADPSS